MVFVHMTTGRQKTLVELKVLILNENYRWAASFNDIARRRISIK